MTRLVECWCILNLFALQYYITVLYYSITVCSHLYSNCTQNIACEPPPCLFVVCKTWRKQQKWLKNRTGPGFHIVGQKDDLNPYNYCTWYPFFPFPHPALCVHNMVYTIFSWCTYFWHAPTCSIWYLQYNTYILL